MKPSLLSHHPHAQDYIAGARDVLDAREAADRYFADLDALRSGKGLSILARPRVSIGAGRPRVGVTSAVGPACDPRRTASGGGPTPDGQGPCQPGDDCGDLPDICGATILGFNSLTDPNFPQIGPVAPAVFTTQQLFVNSGNCCSYKPRKFFFEVRDVNNAFAVSPGLLVSAIVAGQEQLASGVIANGIPSAVFALTCEPLDVNWVKFTNTAQHNLALTFGFFITGASNHVFGAMWGDCTV